MTASFQTEIYSWWFKDLLLATNNGNNYSTGNLIMKLLNIIICETSLYINTTKNSDRKLMQLYEMFASNLYEQSIVAQVKKIDQLSCYFTLLLKYHKNHNCQTEESNILA